MNGAQLSAQIADVKRRALLAVARCVIALVNDGKKMQAVQVNLLEGETRDNVERMQEYGFTSNPLPGAEAVMVSVGGNREHGLVIACDDRRFRVKGMAPGEVCIYSDEGDKVHFKRGKVIEVTTDTLTVNAATAINLNAPTINTNGDTFNVSASASANFTTPDTTMSGHATAQGNFTDLGGTKGTLDHFREVYNTHDHPEVDNDAGGPTGTPNQTI